MTDPKKERPMTICGGAKEWFLELNLVSDLKTYHLVGVFNPLETYYQRVQSSPSIGLNIQISETVT